MMRNMNMSMRKKKRRKRYLKKTRSQRGVSMDQGASGRIRGYSVAKISQRAEFRA